MESNAYIGRPDEFKRDMDKVIKTYNSRAKGQKKGEILTEFIGSISPYMMKLESGDADAIKEERDKDAIRMRELQKKLSMQKKELQNAKSQLKAKDDLIKANKIEMDKERQKNSNTCCAVM